MTPERFEEILNNNRFEPVECFRDKDYIRVISLTIASNALSDGMKIIFIEAEKPIKIPIMEFETFDSEIVELKPEVTEAIAYCISNFDAVWNYFYYQKGTTK